MARPLRIDFENAYHHITCRIINSSFWFKPVKIKQLFYDTLTATSLKFDSKIIAYTIMDNHFHLIVKSGKTSISKFMHALLTSFAIKYNHITNRKGHVFESRFHSFLIEEEEYLLTVIRYVLNNPVRAGIVKSAEEYKWSSFNRYFDITEHPMHLVATDEIMNIFNSKDTFYDYVGKSDTAKISVKKTNRVEIYGSQSYLEKIITLYIKEKRKLPRTISIIPKEVIFQYLKSKYSIESTYLLKPDKSKDKLEARRLFAYLTRKYMHLSLKAIGQYLGVCSSNVSNMIRKIIVNVIDIRTIEMEFLEMIQSN